MTTRSTELLRAVHRNPGVTRADAARLLGIGTGAATELVTKLSRAALLTQAPAAPSGTRGRPTTVLLPHPDGPLVLAVAITHEAWRLDVVELGGATVTSVSERHRHAPWAEVREAVAAAVKEQHARYGPRIRAVGISVPGPVSRTLHLNAFQSDWHGIDLTELWPAPHVEPSDVPQPTAPVTTPGPTTPPPAASSHATPESASPPLAASLPEPPPFAASQPTDVPTAGSAVLIAGNDATLAATAEHLHGAAAGASVALHLRIESGLGGAVIDNGRPVIGARNAAGEFGHMPFGNPEIKCACGANGCWGTAIDGTAMARLLGEPPPRDPVSYARRVIATAARALSSQRARQDLAGLPPPAVAESPTPSTRSPESTSPSHSSNSSSHHSDGPSHPSSSTPHRSDGPSHPPSSSSAHPTDGPSHLISSSSYLADRSSHPSSSSVHPTDGPFRLSGGPLRPSGSSYSSGEAGPDIAPEAALRAVETVGTALGRGIAGLVNALDVDLVTLGGLGPDLLATVPEAINTAYRDGLMTIHRDAPPPVLPAALPDDEGPIVGAAEEAWAALFPHLA
ncbi:ROK family protein [Actinoplanes sp. G11-F43]|uniref:ROK family transcriptional regulator n=1 Tax=Actinoplanes sp. G11-F43 TaxID=3424130 RepID=UPI003D34364D